MWLFIGSIMYTIVYNKVKYNRITAYDECFDTVDTIPVTNKVIIFGAGGGYWPYYLGVAKFIKENYDLSNVTVVGTSAGALAALSLSQQVEVDCTMDNALKLTSRLSTYMLGIFSCNWNFFYRDLIIDNLPDTISTDIPTFIAVSRISWYGLQKKYFKCGTNGFAIADAAITSCWLPFLTAPFFQPLYQIGSNWFVDGYWSGKDKCDRANTIVIYPNTFARLPLSTYWLWLDSEYNKQLYKLGYTHASEKRNVFSLLRYKTV
jgi:hypothetical protein